MFGVLFWEIRLCLLVFLLLWILFLVRLMMYLWFL